MKHTDRVLFTHNYNTPLHSFINSFTTVRDTHFLLLLSVTPTLPSSSVPEVLATISNGDTETFLDDDDDPLWAAALTSPEREYWIAGARDELKSLEDLKVFMLVPQSEVPCGQRPLKGKLVCKRKRDDTGNIS
jgi:hypothetical protein